MSDDVLVDARDLLRRRDPHGKRPGERLELIARLVVECHRLRVRVGELSEEVAAAAKEEQRALFAVEKAAAELERLRAVIRTGGAAYRLERAAMGVPGGIDPEGQPIAKTEGSG